MQFLIVIGYSYLEGFSINLGYTFYDFFYDSTKDTFSYVDWVNKPFEFHMIGSAGIKYMDYS